MGDDEFDKAIEADAKAGKLDKLAEEAKADHAAGLTQPLLAEAKHTPTGLALSPTLRDRPDRLIADIQALQSRALALGMPRTVKALNEALNTAGWEQAEQIKDIHSKRAT